MIDTNAVIREYLAAQAGITALVSTRIYNPRLPENATLPAISFFTRGGISNKYIPPMPEPSIQIDCWADDPITARSVYGAVYDALQGIQNVAVGAYSIASAEEEVQGQDVPDIDIPNYYRVVTFFKVLIK